MNQHLRSDLQEHELSTADLAGTNETAPAEPRFDRTTKRLDTAVDATPRRIGANRSFEQGDPAFFNETSEEEEPDWVRSEPDAIATTDSHQDPEAAPLFSHAETANFHTRWNAVQVSFVDEPRQAVQQADALVAGAIKRLAEIFADERAQLDRQWDRGDSVSTEDLRLALRRYRSFFGRLLSI
jgi:hypothetical protein